MPRREFSWVTHLPEVGPAILRQARELEEQKLEIEQLVHDYRTKHMDLLQKVRTLWTVREYNKAQREGLLDREVKTGN